MKLLIVYDVSTVDRAGARRLRRVAQCCEDFGQRVQKSVFECEVGDKEWAQLRSRLLEAFCPETDSLRVYFLAEDTVVEHHGTGQPASLDGPLVI